MAKGIEVDAMHPDGVSALMYASAGGHPEVVKFLLDGAGPAKADPNLKHVQVSRGRERGPVHLRVPGVRHDVAWWSI